MRFLVLFLLIPFWGTSQVELWQLEYAPDTSYIIGAYSGGEPTWVPYSSIALPDSIYRTGGRIYLRDGGGEVILPDSSDVNELPELYTVLVHPSGEVTGMKKGDFADNNTIDWWVYDGSNWRLLTTAEFELYENVVDPNQYKWYWSHHNGGTTGEFGITADTLNGLRLSSSGGNKVNIEIDTSIIGTINYIDSIITTVGGGTLDGVGVANKVALWAAADSLTYDSLYFNPTNHILGLGTNSPTATGGSFGHQIHGGSFSSLRLTNSTTGATSSDGTSIYSYADSIYLSNLENGIISFATNSVERGRFDSNGFKVDALKSGTTAPTTSGTLVKVVTDANGRLSFQTNNSGTVTSVGLTTGASGTDVSVSGSPITSSGTITLNIPTASATNTGKLSAANWTTFNNKFDLPSLTSGSVLFSNGTTISQNNTNFFWNNSQEQLGIGTNTPNSYIFDGYNGLGIYDATSARIGMANSSRTWIHYLSGTEYRIYNNSFGETFALRSSDGKWQGGSYISTGTNKAAYFDINGVLQRGDYDVLDGVGSGGYVARWFDANTQSTGGLYFPAEAGSQMALGTTSPSTYLQNGTSKGFAIHDASGDPRLSMSNSTRHWVWYLSGNDLSLWNNSSSDLLRLDDAGRVGIITTSPQRTLHVTGEVRITDLVTDTPTLMVGADADGDLTSIYTGTGLLLSGNTLSVNGVGTVTSIATNNGITGGTITTSGTVGLTGQALALHNLATNGLIARTGSGTVAGRTITANTAAGEFGISVSNGDGVSGNPAISFLSNYATLGGVDNLNLTTSYAKYNFSSGSDGDDTGLVVDAANDEIDIATTGAYEFSYTLNCKSNTSSHVVTSRLQNVGTGSYLGGESNHYFDNTNQYSHNTGRGIFNMTSGSSVSLYVKTNSGTPNINGCRVDLIVKRID